MTTSPGSPTHDEEVMFQISLLANQVTGLLGPDLENDLYESILKYFQQHQSQLGRWEVAWGPAVVQFITDAFAVNAMYVAHSLDRPSRYVVAVAGTNPTSLFDWLVEDLLVQVQVPWIYALPSAPAAKISLGTAVGLTILQNAKPSGARPNAGQSLQDFLSGLTTTPVELWTTGHSLGGALAPTLALWLKNIQPLWNPAGDAQISTMPTAGPSAGNSAFSRYSDRVLPATRFVNSLDVVPHAWNETTLAQLKTIYAPSIPESTEIDTLVDRLMMKAAAGDYLSIQPNSPPFKGEINQKIINPQSPPAINYFIQVAYQHVNAYVNFFGMSYDAFGPLLESYRNPYTIITPALRLATRRPGVSSAPEAAQATVASGPRTIPLGGRLVSLPADADDPRMAEVVEMVRAELEKSA